MTPRSPILPVAPEPVPQECVYGYVRRLAEVNGFTSLTRAVSVLGLGGLSPLDDPRSRRDDPWERLCWLTRLPLAAFQGMRWRRAKNPFTGYQSDLILSGARLRHGLADINAFRFCPICVAGTGIFHTAWCLRYCVACPSHNVSLSDSCAECGSRLRSPKDPYSGRPWSCGCGADLRSQHADPANESAVRLAKRIYGELEGATGTTPVGRVVADNVDLATMPLNDALMLIHVLGIASTTEGADDKPVRIGAPAFPFALDNLPSGIPSASRRIEAAFEILDAWPGAFHSLLDRIAHRYPSSLDRRQDKRAFGSRVGKLLLYPPCDLSGRPLPPVYNEVFRFCCDGPGLRLAKRRHHTLDGLARSLYSRTNLSTLSRTLGISSNDPLLGSVLRRILDELSPEDRALPKEPLSSLVEERVQRLYLERMGSISGTDAARILESDAHDRNLSGWDHPSLLIPLEHLKGLGRPRTKSYAAENVHKIRETLAKIAQRRESVDGMVPLRTYAMRRTLGTHYGKTDLLLDLYGRRLPVCTTVATPTIADLWVLPEHLSRCRAGAFIRRHAEADAYLHWSAIVRQLAPSHPGIANVTQWQLDQLARRRLLKRCRAVGRKKWMYSVRDIAGNIVPEL